MTKWKITTNFFHQVVCVMNSKHEEVICLRKVKWTKQMHETIHALVDKHNEEVKMAGKKWVK